MAKDEWKKHSNQKYRGMVLKDFQKMIRMEAADSFGEVICVTCHKRSQWNRGMQAGHFFSRRHNSTAFIEDNVHVQCEFCNGPHSRGGLDGNLIEYTLFMQREYGQEKIDELRAKTRESLQLSGPQLEEMRRGYKLRIKEQEKRLGR